MTQLPLEVLQPFLLYLRREIALRVHSLCAETVKEKGF